MKYANKDQYTKRQLDRLQNISLKRTVCRTYKAEDTLIEHAEIHLKAKSKRFIDSANRILLVICCRCIIPQIKL